MRTKAPSVLSSSPNQCIERTGKCEYWSTKAGKFVSLSGFEKAIRQLFAGRKIAGRKIWSTLDTSVQICAKRTLAAIDTASESAAKNTNFNKTPFGQLQSGRRTWESFKTAMMDPSTIAAAAKEPLAEHASYMETVNACRSIGYTLYRYRNAF